jgi:hypothetical protein
MYKHGHGNEGYRHMLSAEDFMSKVSEAQKTIALRLKNESEI